MGTADLNEVRAWLAAHDLTLLAFTSVGCGVCDALRPRIRDLEERHERLKVRYLDVAESPEVAGQFEVFAVPVYLLSVEGREAMRFARHFGMDELEDAVRRFEGLLDRK